MPRLLPSALTLTPAPDNVTMDTKVARKAVQNAVATNVRASAATRNADMAIRPTGKAAMSVNVKVQCS